MNRIARFAGTWYPADPKELSETVSFVPHQGTGFRFAILPHAGLYYSGELINSFFSILDPTVEKIIILAPSHYHYLQPGHLYTAEFTESETPFGSIPTIPLLTEYSVIDNQVVADEHAIEMFLPFIARQGGLSVSYGLISTVRSVEDVESYAQALLPLIDDKTAVIASSDFTHYGRRFGYMPFGPHAETAVVEHDLACACLLAEGNVEQVSRQFSDSTICGIVPAMIVSRIAVLLGLVGHVDGHATSLDKGGGYDDDFVSYVTVFWR